MRAVLADTGPLYALADPDDRHHDRAREEVTRLEADGWMISVGTPVLFEGYSLVLHRLGIPAAHRWLGETRMGTAEVVVLAEDVDKACSHVRRYTDQALTLVDAVVHELSKRLDVPVWSFDHHFDLMGTEVWR
ncbi:MAG TPA: hypothetical protein VNB06_15630 [Thermoanaerobaculia bacterium]|nr:hypothetical protein [Thermoanaerobaculia bacterium]